MVLNYDTARKKLLTSSVGDCRKFFEKNNNILELAYCDFIDDDLYSAKKRFAAIKDSDLRAKWGLFLINLIDEGKVYEYPTYFEIRNFLELDIQILINHYKGNYVEKFVSYADFLFSINPETYKFIGRVFVNNEMVTQGMFFLDRAKNYFYQDPELHFLLAGIYLKQNDLDNSKIALNHCLEVLPNYYPAVCLKNEIENKLKH